MNQGACFTKFAICKLQHEIVSSLNTFNWTKETPDLRHMHGTHASAIWEWRPFSETGCGIKLQCASSHYNTPPLTCQLLNLQLLQRKHKHSEFLLKKASWLSWIHIMLQRVLQWVQTALWLVSLGSESCVTAAYKYPVCLQSSAELGACVGTCTFSFTVTKPDKIFHVFLSVLLGCHSGIKPALLLCIHVALRVSLTSRWMNHVWTWLWCSLTSACLQLLSV